MKHLRKFEGFFNFKKDKKDPIDVVNLFADIFVDVEDMGGWLSYSTKEHRLVSIDSGLPIYIGNGNEVYIEFKSLVQLSDVRQIIAGGYDMRESYDQNETYLYLKNNLDSLIERFEKLSGNKVSKLSGDICMKYQSAGIDNQIFTTAFNIIVELKRNIFGNRVKFDELEKLPKGYLIHNICLYFTIKL
jgi:hypothetical protein